MPIRETFGEKSNQVLSWTDDIDDKTRQQALNTARLPFVQGHVALMPDAHLGYGATIGSVVATKGAIVPSAVGVDIGCVDGDTEYLGPNGWERIADYEDGPVTQYDLDTGVGHLVQPLAVIRRPQEQFLHFKTKYGIDQMLTDDHRVLAWRPKGRARELHREVLLAGDLAAEHKRLVNGSKVTFETTFAPSGGPGLPLTDAEIRVMVMSMADATMVELTQGHRTVLHLSKTRKIERARKLLDDAGIDFTERPQGYDATYIRFTSPTPEKSYSEWWAASADQLRVVADECLEWDGNSADRVFFTRDEASADFIQYAFAAAGFRAVKRSDVDASDGKVDFRVFAHTATKVGIAGTPKTSVKRVPAVDGTAYCFTVPSGFLVLRRGGNIFVTGNCGMIAVETTLTSHGLPDDLGPLHDRIRGAVPAGVGKARPAEEVPSTYWPGSSLSRPAPHLTTGQHDTAWCQFGTLGGGNHFVEVCLDERDVVWVVLHSGSRGIGKQLADTHIAAAKGLMRSYFIELDDPELAYLVEGTTAFDAYITAMLWAQAYALGNRETMMDAVLSALRRSTPGIEPALEVQRINCHHNFCELESHRGQNVWVTRKGAIRARTGDRGVIPGSMGADTYIVTGLENAASYHSCSHGAGRRMSRNQARNELDVAGLQAAMAGRAWNTSEAEQLLDEDPRAYKDISTVMANQTDLVAVEHRLHQVLNYKGTK